MLVALCIACAGWSLWTVWQRYERQRNATRSQLVKLREAHTRSEGFRQTLRDANVRLEQDLQMAQAGSGELSIRLAATESRLNKYEEERSSVDGELAEFRKIASQFESMVDSGRLDVSYRRGRMVLELPAQLLFPSGKAELTTDGTAALGQVAQILRGVGRRRFVVAGHTDSVPVSGEQFRSNWELSVARALRVTQALIAAGVRPQQLMAAGRAQYEPVASNTNEHGRQKNRRIEIALEPYLSDPGIEGSGNVDVD